MASASLVFLLGVCWAHRKDRCFIALPKCENKLPA